MTKHYSKKSLRSYIFFKIAADKLGLCARTAKMKKNEHQFPKIQDHPVETVSSFTYHNSALESDLSTYANKNFISLRLHRSVAEPEIRIATAWTWSSLSIFLFSGPARYTHVPSSRVVSEGRYLGLREELGESRHSWCWKRLPPTWTRSYALLGSVHCSGAWTQDLKAKSELIYASHVLSSFISKRKEHIYVCHGAHLENICMLCSFCPFLLAGIVAGKQGKSALNENGQKSTRKYLWVNASFYAFIILSFSPSISAFVQNRMQIEHFKGLGNRNALLS